MAWTAYLRRFCVMVAWLDLMGLSLEEKVEEALLGPRYHWAYNNNKNLCGSTDLTFYEGPNVPDCKVCLELIRGSV